MTAIIFIVKESIEGGYEANALDQSIFTEGGYFRRIEKKCKGSYSLSF